MTCFQPPYFDKHAGGGTAPRGIKHVRSQRSSHGRNLLSGQMPKCSWRSLAALDGELNESKSREWAGIDFHSRILGGDRSRVRRTILSLKSNRMDLWKAV